MPVKAGCSMFGIPSINTIAYMALASVTAAILAYAAGNMHGREHERSEALTRSVQVLRERSATNDTIQNMSDSDLCISLGGMPDNTTGECL